MTDWIDSMKWAREYFRHVRPQVVRGFETLRRRALAIPHPDLKEQALSSLETKQFHCEGGGVFAGPSRDANGRLFPFLLPYQTLCDYLDTVTDRGPSQDPTNLRRLHQALLDAVSPQNPLSDYYAFHPHQDDGGYINYLVAASREALSSFPGLLSVLPHMQRLVSLYIDLQVFKHGPEADRVPRLTAWWHQSCPPETDLTWWEFSAATGSTLGLFALLNVAVDAHPEPSRVEHTLQLYFPWVGALHILLDYFVDEEEDRLGGDLNFVTYYASKVEAVRRIRHIYQRALDLASTLPDATFHRYVIKGLLGFYLSDRKLRRPHFPKAAWQLLKSGGSVSLSIYFAALIGRSP